jgi:ADP-heptose:LPS heptosyltransferase
LEIGRICGWNVLPFDNALEDFFKNPRSLPLPEFLRRIRSVRRHKVNLWIDLTGSAVSAIAIKLAGARKVAARVTRGGRSLLNYHLPHALHENEYANVQRVAHAIGCKPDYDIFKKLRGAPALDDDAVVLCLTTVCPWRNWPLQNFTALVDAFPHVRFIATGMRAEVPVHDQPVLHDLLTRPNVTSRLDQTSVLELVHLIAHARAVVTNDTSTAHIANAFAKPGAVLFGPASPERFAAPDGLRPFVDSTCPFHPCVQWTCRNQENWCMRKISVEAVVSHLASVLATSEAYAATANIG